MINERKRLKVKFCKGRNARLTLSFQYVNRWFKTLKTALPYTLSGSTEPGSISLEPWESLFTVSRVTSLNSHLHRILTLPLPSLSSQTLWVATLFSVVISRPPQIWCSIWSLISSTRCCTFTSLPAVKKRSSILPPGPCRVPTTD